MDNPASTQRNLAHEEQRHHIAGLLLRYPQIDAAEEAAILRFLKKAPAVQTGLLTADESVRPQLERFKSDHSREFTVGPKGMAIAAAIIAAIVALCMLLWDIGA